MTYVAMYRMTDVDNFFIVPGCSSEKLTITETKKSKKLQARLADDVRLMLAPHKHYMAKTNGKNVETYMHMGGVRFKTTGIT